MNYLFRDTDDVEGLLDLMHKRGVRAVADESKNISAEILAAIQEVERHRSGERLAAGRAVKRERDGFCGGSVRFGYRRSGDGFHPDEREQEVIRIASEMWPENSLRKICQKLSFLGYKNRNGSPLHPQTVARILSRTVA